MCIGAMERYVWDGDVLLYELRALGHDSLHGGSLETEVSYGDFFGKIRYLHDGQVDQPVIVWKDDNDPLVPHWTYRGLAVAATYADGSNADNDFDWPSQERGAFYGPETGVAPIHPLNWIGNLTESGVDGSGLMYRRNRYYNPQTGGFSQEDPIGIAGGLNLYGFGSGDPVNYSDPFGLCTPEPQCFAAALQQLGRMAPAMNQMLGGFAALSVLGGASIAGVAVLTAGGGAAITTLGVSVSAARVGGAATAVVSGLGSKADARQALSGLSLGSEQLQAARSAISRGTGASTYDLIKQASGDLFVHIYRPGRDGFQVIQSIISRSGGKTVTQYGIDAAGKVLVDRKYP